MATQKLDGSIDFQDGPGVLDGGLFGVPALLQERPGETGRRSKDRPFFRRPTLGYLGQQIVNGGPAYPSGSSTSHAVSARSDRLRLAFPRPPSISRHPRPKPPV